MDHPPRFTMSEEWRPGNGGPSSVSVNLRPLCFWSVEMRRVLWRRRKHPKLRPHRQEVLMREVR